MSLRQRGYLVEELEIFKHLRKTDPNFRKQYDRAQKVKYHKPIGTYIMDAAHKGSVLEVDGVQYVVTRDDFYHPKFPGEDPRYSSKARLVRRVGDNDGPLLYLYFNERKGKIVIRTKRGKKLSVSPESKLKKIK